MLHQKKDRKSLNKIFFKVLLAFACALLVWEIILQNTHTLKPGAVNHPVLGRIYQPGLLVNGIEGYCRTYFNELGMRGRLIGDQLPTEQRVLLLGDSFTEAVQVWDQQMYATVLENLLSPDGNLHVINAGRSNASPAYYLHLANFYQTTFKPDRVVIQMNDGDYTKDLLDKTLPFYVTPTKDGFETQANNQPVSLPLLRPFLELSISRVAFQNIKEMLGNTKPEDTASESKPGIEIDYAPLIDWTLRELKVKYGNPILLYLPKVNYFAPDEDSTNIEMLVSQAAKKAGLEVVNMRSDFVNYYQATHQVASGFNNTQPGIGHLNAIGHELVARRLASRLSRESIK